VRSWGWIALIAGIAAVGAVVASSRPDGLERVAEDLGFAERAVERPALADYGPLTAVVGAALVGGLAYAAGRTGAR
jgi:hypothetical protein